MTNKAINIKVVKSQKVYHVPTKQVGQFDVQVKMDLVLANGNTQTVQFGYAAVGGRATYVKADSKAPQRMSRQEFIKVLRTWEIANLKQVEKELGKLRFFNKNDILVAQCECCGRKKVTAAHIDYIQRNHKALSEKLGREVTEFSRICFDCQNGKPTPKKEAPAKQQPVKQEIKEPPTSGASFDFSPALIAEIMALNVDAYSEIAKLQRELEEKHYNNIKEVSAAWIKEHSLHVTATENRIPTMMEEIMNDEELPCFICDEVGHLEIDCPHRPKPQAELVVDELPVVEDASEASDNLDNFDFSASAEMISEYENSADIEDKLSEFTQIDSGSDGADDASEASTSEQTGGTEAEDTSASEGAERSTADPSVGSSTEEETSELSDKAQDFLAMISSGIPSDSDVQGATDAATSKGNTEWKLPF